MKDQADTKTTDLFEPMTFTDCLLLGGLLGIIVALLAVE